MWQVDDPQANEAAKIKYEIVRWTRGRGLDLGCGPYKAYKHFIGVDNQPYPGDGPNFITDCATDLSLFADGSMDFVFSSHLLEHIVDTERALKEWWRKIGVGGYLVLYVPHKMHYPNIGQKFSNPDHKHDFLPGDIIDIMKKVAPDWDLLEDQTRTQYREYSFLQVYEKKPEGSGHALSCMKPRPAKKAAVVRYGAHGDALWASSILPHLKAEGYHVTMYVESPGAVMLQADPNIDDFYIVDENQVPNSELLMFWLWQEQKYDRFINLVGSIETRLLPQPSDTPFFWPQELRHKLMNVNYLETVHEFAGVPMEFHQKFYPTEEERAWALKEKNLLDGPVVVVNPTGSSLPKTWPHVQRYCEMMSKGAVHVVVLGDLGVPARRGVAWGEFHASKYTHIVGMNWPIRRAMAFALQADLVIGVESALVNAVAFEEMPKIVLLSHSSPENLTKHWRNTIAFEPVGLDCYPCHRVHLLWHFCSKEKKLGAAACQTVPTAEKIAEMSVKFLAERAVA